MVAERSKTHLRIAAFAMAVATLWPTPAGADIGYKQEAYLLGVTASACATYSPAYGGIYDIKVFFTKAPSAPNVSYALYTSNGPGQWIGQNGNGYYLGRVAVLSAWVSAPEAGNGQVDLVYKPPGQPDQQVMPPRFLASGLPVCP